MGQGVEKRNSILQAAEEIFCQKGLKDSTITEIAHKAGVVDSIIYHYFKNKEDLLFCAFDKNIKVSYENLMFHFRGIFGPISKLGKMIWYHLFENDYDTGHARILKSLQLECRSNKNFYEHEGAESLRKYVNVMTDILNQGIELDLFRKDINTALVREMVFGLLDEVSLSHISAGRAGQTTADLDAIISLVLAMIENKSAPESENNYKASRVLKAATDEFARKGYNKATMVDVGQAAGVAEGTIYEYFKSKQDLLLSIPMVKFQYYRQSLEECLSPEQPLARLKNLIGQHFCILSSDPEFLTVFLSDIKLNKNFYVSGSYPYYLDYIQPLFQLLDDGKQKGVFRPEVDNRIYRHLFIGSFTHMAVRWFLRGKPSPLGMMTEFGQMTDLLCRAVAV
jgi:TetR/AcrR family fatty acid metabolism transcriptional regulator